MRCHAMRVVVQDPADDLLGHVSVDQSGAESVAKPVGGDADRATVFVANVAGHQPLVQRPPVDVAEGGFAPVRIVQGPRKEHWCALRPPVAEVLLVVLDLVFELFIDGHECFTFHLVVEVAQVGCTVTVADDAVVRQPDRVGDPQSAAHQDHGDQPVAGVPPPVQVGGLFELRHHDLAQRPRQAFGPRWKVLGEEHRPCRQRVVPAVLADREEEQVELPDVVGVRHPACVVGVQVGEIAFEKRPVDLIETVDVDRRRGQELAEVRDRSRA